MTGRHSESRLASNRGFKGERVTVRAEQLRALGIPYRCIARQLRVDRDVVLDWFAQQDELAHDAGVADE